MVLLQSNDRLELSVVTLSKFVNFCIDVLGLKMFLSFYRFISVFFFLCRSSNLGFDFGLNSFSVRLRLSFDRLFRSSIDFVGLVCMLIMIFGGVVIRMIPVVTMGIIVVNSIFLLSAVLESHRRVRCTIRWLCTLHIVGGETLVKARISVRGLSQRRVFHLLLEELAHLFKFIRACPGVLRAHVAKLLLHSGEVAMTLICGVPVWRGARSLWGGRCRRFRRGLGLLGRSRLLMMLQMLVSLNLLCLRFLNFFGSRSIFTFADGRVRR